jgi:hypothetical protein
LIDAAFAVGERRNVRSVGGNRNREVKLSQ